MGIIKNQSYQGLQKFHWKCTYLLSAFLCHVFEVPSYMKVIFHYFDFLFTLSCHCYGRLFKLHNCSDTCGLPGV